MTIYEKQNLVRSSQWAWRIQHVALAFICFQKHSIVLATSSGILVLLDDDRDSQLYEGRLLDESNALNAALYALLIFLVCSIFSRTHSHPR